MGFLLTAALPAQERSQARSMVITQRGIAATSQTLASQAAAQILARGGSAVDAAIAANAVLAVVEPMMCGMGGDLFAIHWDAKTDKLTGINASGWSPKALTIDWLKTHDSFAMPSSGIHTVTVPGAVDGWDKMHKKFGRLPWRDLFQPAIYYARNGFPVTEIIQYDWEDSSGKLSRDPNAHRVFLKNGRRRKSARSFVIPNWRMRLNCWPAAKPPRSTEARSPRHSEDLAQAGRHVDRRGFRRLPERVGSAHLDQISRLVRLSVAPERPGCRHSGDAEHHGAVSAAGVRAKQC